MWDPIPDQEAAATVGELLREIGYDEEAIEERLGEDGIAAEGSEALVMDIKTGSGAFMATLAEARELASSIIATAQTIGLEVSALITDMSEVLGYSAGNAVEELVARRWQGVGAFVRSRQRIEPRQAIGRFHQHVVVGGNQRLTQALARESGQHVVSLQESAAFGLTAAILEHDLGDVRIERVAAHDGPLSKAHRVEK